MKATPLDKLTISDQLGTQTNGHESVFRGLFINEEGRTLHTNPRRTRQEAHEELKDYLRRMPWLQGVSVEEII